MPLDISEDLLHVSVGQIVNTQGCLKKLNCDFPCVWLPSKNDSTTQTEKHFNLGRVLH
jgi:hypothetical protein